MSREIYESVSRETFVSACQENFQETGLTFLYGLTGTALSVGAPLIGTINFPLAVLLAVIPVLSKWREINLLAKTNKNVKRDRMYHYAQAVIKAAVNTLMLSATYSIGFAFGPTACFLFVLSFCISKFINLGDGSPIEHLEDIVGIEEKKYPKNRPNLLRSLSANSNDTLKAGFYGLIAVATQFPIPWMGQLTQATASIFIISPIYTRVNQINQMENEGHIESSKAKYHRAKALVSTFMDILVGVGLFATATLLQLDKIAILALFIGWAAGKLTSGGEKSPIYHVQTLFNRISGAKEEVANSMLPAVTSTSS